MNFLKYLVTIKYNHTGIFKTSDMKHAFLLTILKSGKTYSFISGLFEIFGKNALKQMDYTVYS